MAAEKSAEVVRRELPDVLPRMRPGERVTLVDADGTPLATIVAPEREPGSPKSLEEWEAAWDVLVEKISKAWKGNMDAVEAIAEQRR